MGIRIITDASYYQITNLIIPCHISDFECFHFNFFDYILIAYLSLKTGFLYSLSAETIDPIKVALARTTASKDVPTPSP